MAKRGERKPEKKGGGIGNFLSTLVIILALGVFCYAGWQLFTIYMAYKAGSDEYKGLESGFVQMEKKTDVSGVQKETEGFDAENMAENETMDPEKWGDAHLEPGEGTDGKPLEKMENPINFDELLAINDEIVGWLEVEALDISYPLMQAADNDYYLHRTFRRQDNFAGSVFLDCGNRPDLSNRNNVIYGHNMKDGSMFGTLKKFKEQETYDKSPYFWVYTPTKIYKYEIFSASVVGTYSESYQIVFKNAMEFQAFLNTAKEQTVIETKAQTNFTDTVVTLSTCTGDTSTRFIVQGKRVRTYQSVPKAGGYETEAQTQAAP